MELTGSFVTLPENDNNQSTFRKPGLSLRDGNKTVPKSAFSDLSNRVPRGTFRPGTPRKTAFSGKPLTFQVPQDKGENYDFLQFTKKATEMVSESVNTSATSDQIAPVEVVRDSTADKNVTTSEINRDAAFTEFMNSDEEDELDFPETETFFHSTLHRDDFDFYSSRPFTPIVYESFDYEGDYDFAKELTRRYPYKDDEPEFGRCLSPAEETEMYMLDSEGDESDGSVMY